MSEQVEVLNENVNNDKIIPLNDILNNNTNNKDNVISLDRLFEEDEEVIDVYEENQKLEEIRQKKITKIQIGLIIFLVFFASIVYFFGYNFFEPFIKID